MASLVKDTDLGLKAFVRELQKAKTATVTIGIHATAHATIAEYATANEYGTEHIPSRPFMRTSFDENVGDIQRDMDRGYQGVINGGTVHRALSMAGLKHQGRIVSIINDRDFLPKLKPATVKAKKGSTKTLIDSGAMKNSIRYVVHK